MIFSIIIWINMILDQANLAAVVIGWIQFGLLTITIGLPILLLLIVLVVPVKYELKGALCEAKEFPDEEAEGDDESGGAGDIMNNIKGMIYNVTDHIKGKGKFSWLSGLIKGEMSYKDRELSWRATIFVKKLSSEDVNEQEDEDGIKSKDTGEKSSVGLDGSESEKTGVGLESSESKRKSSVSLDSSKPEKKSSVGLDSNEAKRKSSVSLENRQDVKVSKTDKVQDTHIDEKDNIVDEDQGFFEKMEDGYEKINEKMEYTYEQICDKIDLVSEVKEKISQFIHDETHQEAYNVFVKGLKKLLRMLKPTKIKGNLKVGFENPGTTGLFVAGASLLYPYVSRSAKLEADFEQEVLEGDLCVKGKLRLGSLAWFATKMAINKNVQITIKDIMKNIPKDLNVKKT